MADKVENFVHRNHVKFDILATKKTLG